MFKRGARVIYRNSENLNQPSYNRNSPRSNQGNARNFVEAGGQKERAAKVTRVYQMNPKTGERFYNITYKVGDVQKYKQHVSEMSLEVRQGGSRKGGPPVVFKHSSYRSYLAPH